MCITSKASHNILTLFRKGRGDVLCENTDSFLSGYTDKLSADIRS